MVKLIMSGSGEGKTKQLLALMDNFDALKGFICGLYAGNYDISHIFIDNLSKIAHSKDLEQTGAFLDWLDSFCSPLNLKVTLTLSGDPEAATETMRKYL